MPRTRTLVLLTSAAIAAYGFTLIGTSLASEERILGPGESLRFCGFYLDCHRMVEVLDVATTEVLAAGRDTLRAAGTFRIVTVRYTSDAVRAAMRIGPQAAAVRDTDGRWYPRAEAAERLLGITGLLPEVRLRPGQAFTTRFVFDLPPDARAPMLRIRDADPVAQVAELFLIGDDDSFLHARPFFALSNRTTSVTGLRPSTVDLLGVRVDAAAGIPPARVPADGLFYTVTLAVPADTPLVATVMDAAGRSWRRARDVEDLLHRTLPLADAPRRVRFVFDLPDEVDGPRLVLREPGLLHRLFGPRVTLPL